MKKIVVFLFSLFFINDINAQIGIGTQTPNPSTILDVYATDKAMLVPRLTTTQRNQLSTPIAGMVIFNTDSACIEIYRGMSWFNLCAGSNSIFDGQVVPYMPATVLKTSTKKTFAHLLPWFETKATNNGSWGIHWTMANKNPDNILPNGNRDIASHYYPLTGPYASGDTTLIDYQILLMKLSGIDGVFIDWPGTGNNNGQNVDIILNERNTKMIVSRLARAGLKFALVYEDNFLSNVTDKILQAKKDIRYADTVYFNKSNYEYVYGKPLLMVFGPQQLQTAVNWTQVFSVLNHAPSFCTLWYESAEAGSNAIGEFSWIYTDYLTGLNNFYHNSYTGLKIASVYPGFKTFYANGGWGGPTWEIPHNGTTAFNATLDLALATNNDYIQLNTWNDYGEGTMIEPTDSVNNGFGFSYLKILQQKLGVAALNQSDLEAVLKWYNLCKSNIGNAANLNKLNQVYYYFVSLQTNKAKQLLATF